MVAQKRGRGGKAAKAKAAAQAEAEQQAAEAAVDESVESVDDNGAGEGGEQPADESAAESQPESADQSQEAAAEAEAKPEEPKAEKVEPGKLLVENVPISYLFDYQEKLKEVFSKHGEVNAIKRGPINVTEQTTTPTLSAIVEFKNKDSLEKALTENGTVLDGRRIKVEVESRADTAVLIGVPYEANNEYVRQLLGECGEVAQIQEFSKTKYKILRVTFAARESVEKALKLDRELRINGFLVTITKYRDDDDQKQYAAAVKQKRHNHPEKPNRQNAQNNVPPVNNVPPPVRQNNNFRGRGGFNARAAFRGMAGGRGRGGFPARGGAFPRGGFAGGINNYMPPAPYMPRPGGFMNDGQRPNKRLRQM